MFYKTGRLITVFKGSRHTSISSARLIRTLVAYFLNTHFNILLSTMIISSKFFRPLMKSDYIFVCTSRLPRACFMSCPPYPLCDTPLKLIRSFRRVLTYVAQQFPHYKYLLSNGVTPYSDKNSRCFGNACFAKKTGSYERITGVMLLN